MYTMKIVAMLSLMVAGYALQNAAIRTGLRGNYWGATTLSAIGNTLYMWAGACLYVIVYG